MVFKSILGAVSVLLSIVTFNVNAALVERLGGLAYYDTEADLTWLADANYAATSGYQPYFPAGTMNWDQAVEWAANLDVAGVTGWRLPDIDPSCSPGSPCTTSEMGNLFHNVLGNVGGSLSFSVGLFSNVERSFYWQAQDVATLYGYTFEMWNGQQGSIDKIDGYYAWAVHTGDVSAVPVPAAVWLFGSGLIGLAGFARRRKV